MTRLLSSTLNDVRHGRETLRVYVAFCFPSLLAALTLITI